MHEFEFIIREEIEEFILQNGIDYYSTFVNYDLIPFRWCGRIRIKHDENALMFKLKFIDYIL